MLAATASIAQGEITPTVITEDVIVIRGLVANMAVVRTDDGLVVVDSLISPLHARSARRAITERFPGQPVRYLINTHYHPDHNFGNQEFAEATIITHSQHVTRFPGTSEFSDIMARAPDELDRLLQSLGDSAVEPDALDELKLWHKRLARYSGFRPRTADLTLDRGATLILGGKTVSILHLGAGHTDGDLAVFFEEDRTLVTGDLVFRDTVPVIDGGGGFDIDGWIESLTQLRELGPTIEHVIPGHGDAGDGTLLEEQERYLRDLRRVVEDARSRGLTVDDAKASATLDRYDSYTPLFGEVDGNVEEYWNLLDAMGSK